MVSVIFDFPCYTCIWIFNMPLNKLETWPSLPFRTKKLIPNLSGISQVLIECTTERNWKHRRKKKKRFFFPNIFLLVLRINSVLPFSTGKQLIQTPDHASANTMKCYGTMHRYNEMPPEHVALGPCKGNCGGKQHLSTFASILFCKHGEGKSTDFFFNLQNGRNSSKMEKFRNYWNFF